MAVMTETLETQDTTAIVHEHRPNRLNQAVAWVAIVAGVVFIVGSVFFTGFFLGRHSGHGGHGGGRHHGNVEMLRPWGPPPGMPMMGPGMPPPPPGAPTAAPNTPPAR